MVKLKFYITLLAIAMISCKGTKQLTQDQPQNDVAPENSIYVMDIVTEVEVLDSTKYNPDMAGMAGGLLSAYAKTLFVHDDDRVAKVTFDEDGRTKTHLFYNSDNTLLRYYSEIEKGEPYFTEFKLDTAFLEDQIPIVEQKIRADGLLVVDSTSQHMVEGYDCFEISFTPDEVSSMKYYLSNEIPKFEGLIGAMMNMQFDFSLKTVQDSQEEGLRTIKTPTNKRIDKSAEKYLELNATTYTPKE